jgi:ParB family transcriptional regulator, chromosome partitioning protein
MALKKEALGKGIRALLDNIDAEATVAREYTPAFNSMLSIPLESIEVNPFQPRTEFDENNLRELTESIRIHGVIQPITVRQLSSKKYQLIAGERRLRAAKMAGLAEIPAFTRTANDEEMLEMALIENTHREDLNALEIAINYKRLIDECGLKQEDLAQRVGRDRSTVTNFLRLLKLPPDIQQGLRNKEISMGHARALIAIEDPMVQLYLYKEVLKKGLSVRQTEQLVRDYSDKKIKIQSKKVSAALPFEYKRIQDKLQSEFGTKIQVKVKSNNRGEIIIHFFSQDDLERILDILE